MTTNATPAVPAKLELSAKDARDVRDMVERGYHSHFISFRLGISQIRIEAHISKHAITKKVSRRI